MPQTLDNPFYYLENFQRVVSWVGHLHHDLLTADEHAFVQRFPQLPRASRALLVRMAMRKGALFRASRLRYAEIGCAQEAAAPLIAEGWVSAAPAVDLEALFGLLTKAELAANFPQLRAGQRKAEQRAALSALSGDSCSLADWCPTLDEQLLRLDIEPWCQRLRLLFFGNLRQDWSEFVLADLGLYRYEQVDLRPDSRAFHSRQELDDYLHLHRCRERFEAGETAAAVLTAVPRQPYPGPWLEARRGKLLLQLGQQLERDGALAEALAVHRDNPYPAARVRAIRVLERLDEPTQAHRLALAAAAAPHSEHETQQLERILPRLRRQLGLGREPRATAQPVETFERVLPRPDDGRSVEWVAREHLAEADGPVHYLENSLINALFGLLCWEAIFAPLPGAFFHPYHSGPADLNRPDFAGRRADAFARCLALLDDERHGPAILATWRAKHGLQNPFVAWPLLDEALLQTALDCLPAAHLAAIFRRLLADLPANRSGLPDLIQFWPAQRRYRMIEVKGPGDRLQDNQIRWLDYAVRHSIPVAVCHVRWDESP